MLDQQHPIPQQVSSYQFKLVGDMTLNQFFQVAGGALVSLLIYASDMNAVLKWPLIVISFLLGLAFAFFPLQDRPLLTWLLLFFKAIYAPTIYVWEKGAAKKNYFAPEGNLVQQQSGTQTQQTTQNTIQPVDLSALNPAQTSIQASSFDKEEEEFLEKIEETIQTPTTASKTNIPISIPKTDKPSVAQPTPQFNQQAPVASSVGEKITPSLTQNMGQSKAANFVPEVSPPDPPGIANVVVGQVINSQGKIIPNAILEILDKDGRPVRALRSNRLGHFMIVTPLANGKYVIRTEKEGLIFEPISFDANGEIIKPIAVMPKEK